MRSLLITASLLALAPVAAQAQTALTTDDGVNISDLMTRWGKAVTTDVEDEINGLLTYDRAVPKASAEALAAIAAPLWKTPTPN